MRLDFNILWVEDQPDRVRSYSSKIDRQIRKSGFRVQTVFAKTVDEAKAYLSSDIYGDHIDLVLMDYDLGAGPKGDEGLKEVRRLFPYKDVIFYSAQQQNLNDILAATDVQGVFSSDREGLPDMVIGLFETLVKKVLDIDHSRGVIMGSSSEIDGIVLDSLTAHFASAKDVLSAEAITIVAKRIAELEKNSPKNLKKVLAATKVKELADLHHTYTSMDRLNLLRKLLQADTMFQEACESLKEYADNAVPRRNDLAHIRVKKEGFSRKLFDRNQKEITRDDMSKLLVAFLKHQEDLEKLLNLLSSQGDQS